MSHTTNAPTSDEITTADAQLIAALRPINRRRRVPLGRVRSFWPTADYSSPVLSAEVVYDPSALAPAYSDGKRIILGKDAFRYLDSTRRLGRAFAAACGRLERSIGNVDGKSSKSTGDHARADDTVPIRYAATATQPIGVGQGGGSSAAGGTSGHRVGETKTVGGTTYRLNQNHRWELVDQGGGSTTPGGSPGLADTLDAPATPPIDQAQTIDAPSGVGQDAGSPTPGGQPGERWKGDPAGGAAGQQFPIDSTTHEQRHKFVSAQLSKVHGEARRMMAAMMQTPAYKQGGETATKDFDQSQAKSLYDWMQQNVGQEQSDGSKVVDLQNGRLGFSTPAGAIAVWPPDANGRQKVGFTNKTGVVGRAMGLGGGAGATQPATQPATQQPPPGAAVAGAELSPEAAPGNPLEPERPTPVPQSGQPPQQPATPATTNQGPPAAAETPSQASANTPSDTPPDATPSEPPAPPVDPRPHRQAANEARARLDEAISTWEQAVNMGLDAKGNARWRSYVAALKRQWSEKDQFARQQEREHGRTTKEAGKQEQQKQREGEKAKQKQQLEEKRQAREKEIAARRAEDDADRQARREAMRKRLEERTERQKKGYNSPAPGEQWRHAGDAFKKKPEAETPLIDNPPGEGGTGDVPSGSPESYERLKLPKGQQKLHNLADKYLDHFGVSKSDKNRKFLSEQIKNGRLKNPKDLRTVMRTAKKLEARSTAKAHGKVNPDADDHSHLREAVRRKANYESRVSWQAVRNKKAEEWGMEPAQYEEFARDIWKDHLERHDEREAAKKHLKKLVSGGRSIDENKLGDVDSIKGLDQFISELHGMFPNVGFTDGDETGHNEELAYELLKEKAKRAPGRTSQEFTDRIDEYLGHLQASAGRSSGSSAPAGGPPDDEESIPFARRKNRHLRRMIRKGLTRQV